MKIKVIKIRKASKVRTIIITLVLLLAVSFMGTSFTFLGGVAENKFTDNCNYAVKLFCYYCTCVKILHRVKFLQAYLSP